MDSAASVRTRNRYISIIGLVGLLSTFGPWSSVYAQSDAVPVPNWIWSAERSGGKTPAGICYFRKTFIIPEKTQGWIDVACDEQDAP